MFSFFPKYLVDYQKITSDAKVYTLFFLLKLAIGVTQSFLCQMHDIFHICILSNILGLSSLVVECSARGRGGCKVDPQSHKFIW